MLHASRVGRIAAAVGGCATLVITGIAAAPTASASAIPAVNCSWKPSNNSALGTGFSGSDFIYMHPGPSRACGDFGYGYPGDEVYAHCWTNGQNVDGVTAWVYLTDYSTGFEGWVNYLYVNNLPSDMC
jgi:hypothetical protein